MKICLINAPCLNIDDANLEPPLGLLYIASTLRESGYDDINIFTMTDCKDELDIREKLLKIPYADIYGFTVYCTNYKYVKLCIEYIHSKFKSIIVLGGPNASAIPEFTLNDSKCDFVIVGEGENSFLDIVKYFTYQPRPFKSKDLSSILYGKIEENLNMLPIPAWNLVDLNNYTRVLNGERVISIISSRGCPNNCVHCNSIVMGAGRKIRYRSIDNVIKEIKILKELGFNSFRFSDDNFACRPNLREMTLALKELNIKYRIFAHIKDLTDETCKLLSESGCLHISIGIESLNRNNLKFLHKNTNVDIIYSHLINIKRWKMMSRLYFIVGLPCDSDSSIDKYFTIASYMPFDEFSAYPLLPYPGTAIYKTPEKFGYKIIEKDWTKYYQIGENRFTCFALDHEKFTHNDVERWLKFVYKILENHGKIQNGNSEFAK